MLRSIEMSDDEKHCTLILDEVDQLDDDDLLYNLIYLPKFSLLFIPNREEDLLDGLSPTGAAVNRVLVVGALTEVQNVGSSAPRTSIHTRTMFWLGSCAVHRIVPSARPNPALRPLEGNRSAAANWSYSLSPPAPDSSRKSNRRPLDSSPLP